MYEHQTVVFSNEISLNGKLVFQACSKALKAIESELPEEARSYEIYDFIIDTCKQKLKEKKIIL